MPTISEVDEFILVRIANATQVPKMFASSPGGFEDMLIQLDLVRAFLNDLIVDRWHMVPGKGYLNYLSDNGYGVATITGRCEVDHAGGVADEEVYLLILDEWNNYMSSGYRV